MTINSTFLNDVLTVSLSGRLDSLTADDLDTYLVEHVTAEVDRLVIDFNEVDYISSKGLRSLIKAYKMMNGRPISIQNAGSAVTDVLKMSGLLKYFQTE